MTGPSAILGKLFNTTIYGSATRRNVSDHHSKIAITDPSTVEMIKPAIHSSSVMPMCLKMSWLTS